MSNLKNFLLQPTVGTHYDLEQTASGRLELTYKKGFLQKYEHGSGSLNPTITLKATDGRVFKKTYTFGIKSNTPPPKPEKIVIAKTKITGMETKPYYVLCLKFNSSEMTKTVEMNSGTVPVHKDIAKITINDTPYDLLYKEDNSDFKKPDGDSFVTRGSVDKLTENIPLETEKWVLYYKTNIKIGDGNQETSYTITLSDKEGVTSDEAAETIAASGKTHTVTFSVEDGRGGTLKGTCDGLPHTASGNNSVNLTVPHRRNVTFIATPDAGWAVDSWKVDGRKVPGHTDTRYTLSNVTDDKTVTVKFKKVYTVKFRVVDGEGGILKGSYGGNTRIATGNNIEEFTNVSEGTLVSFEATPYPGWKVKGWTFGGSSVPEYAYETYGTPPITGNKIVTVEFERVTTIQNGNDFAWKLLKNAVEVAVDGATITIEGEIKASGHYEEDWGQIVINNKNLTIEGKTGAGTDILDANKMSRIFKVENGATLTLKKLTLKGGKPNETEDADKCGGAIYAKDASTVKIENCIITGNEAETNGGGIYVESTPTTITNCTFTRNTAIDGGGIYINKTGGSNPVVKIIDGTIGGTGQGNIATGNGGGIYVGQSCLLRLNDSTDSGTQGVLITGNEAPNGKGVYAANNATVSMQGGTQINVYNDVYLDTRSAILVNSVLTTTDTVARITVPENNYAQTTKVLYGNAVGSEYGKFAVTPKDGEEWEVSSLGLLKKKN